MTVNQLENSCFLIAGEQQSVSEALSLIRLARPCVQPNTGFVRQLCAYSQDQQALPYPTRFLPTPKTSEHLQPEPVLCQA